MEETKTKFKSKYIAWWRCYGMSIAFCSFFFSLTKQNIFIIIAKQLFFIQVSADGVDGGEIHLTMPSESQVSSLVATSELEHKKRLGIYLTTFLWFYCFRSTNK